MTNVSCSYQRREGGTREVLRLPRKGRQVGLGYSGKAWCTRLDVSRLEQRAGLKGGETVEGPPSCTNGPLKSPHCPPQSEWGGSGTADAFPQHICFSPAFSCCPPDSACQSHPTLVILQLVFGLALKLVSTLWLLPFLQDSDPVPPLPTSSFSLRPRRVADLTLGTPLSVWHWPAPWCGGLCLALTPQPP